MNHSASRTTPSQHDPQTEATHTIMCYTNHDTRDKESTKDIKQKRKHPGEKNKTRKARGGR